MEERTGKKKRMRSCLCCDDCDGKAQKLSHAFHISQGPCGPICSVFAFLEEKKK